MGSFHLHLRAGPGPGRSGPTSMWGPKLKEINMYTIITILYDYQTAVPQLVQWLNAAVTSLGYVFDSMCGIFQFFSNYLNIFLTMPLLFFFFFFV